MIVTIILSSLILITTAFLGIFATLGKKAVSEGVNWSYSIESNRNLNWDE